MCAYFFLYKRTAHTARAAQLALTNCAARTKRIQRNVQRAQRVQSAQRNVQRTAHKVLFALRVLCKVNNAQLKPLVRYITGPL